MRKSKGGAGLALALAAVLAASMSGCSVTRGNSQKALVDWETVDTGAMKQVQAWSYPAGDVARIKLALRPGQADGGGLVSSLCELAASKDGNIHIIQRANCALEAKKPLACNLRDGNLELTMPGASYLFGATEDRSRVQYVRVELPADYGKALSLQADAVKMRASDLQLSDLQVDADASYCRFSNVKTGKLQVELDAGNLICDDVQADAAPFQIDVDAAALQINALRGAGKVEVDAGSAIISQIEMRGDLLLDVDAGSLHCDMAKGSSFHFTGDADAGSISTYFQNGATTRSGKVQQDVGAQPQHVLTAQVDAGRIKIGEAAG